MGLTYFKRFQMDIDLTRPLFEAPSLPAGYSLIPWNQELVDTHASVKYRSFCFELDANVFPCLGDREGCQRLMRDISRRENFVPEATWLLHFGYPGQNGGEFCGTIQGIQNRSGQGAVQNLGITPEHRGLGLGTRLLHQSLMGFSQREMKRAMLEVTAQNVGAFRLYERLGFRQVKTVYKAVEVAYV